MVPDKSKIEESDASSETSGDRSRKISSDDVPEEKGNCSLMHNEPKIPNQENLRFSKKKDIVGQCFLIYEQKSIVFYCIQHNNIYIYTTYVASHTY
jgi:hypothetical protein